MNRILISLVLLTSLIFPTMEGDAASVLILVQAPAAPSKFYVTAGACNPTGGCGSGGGSNTFSSAIGTATATRVILIGVWQQNTAFTSVQVQGSGTLTTATPILTGAVQTTMQFYQITGAGPGSGTATITLNGGGFLTQFAQVWYMDGLTSTTAATPTQTTGANVSTLTSSLNLNSGDFLFTLASQFGTFSWSTSTNSPANQSNQSSGGAFMGASDWTVSTTSASWSDTVTWTSGNTSSNEQISVSFR